MNTLKVIENGSPNDAWKPCRPGEFAELSKRLRAHRGRRTAIQTAVGATLGLLIVVGLWTAFRTQEQDNHFAGISCSRVLGLALAIKMGKLEPGLRNQVRAHVMRCPRCQSRFKAMGMTVSSADRRPGESIAALAVINVSLDPDRARSSRVRGLRTTSTSRRRRG